MSAPADRSMNTPEAIGFALLFVACVAIAFTLPAPPAESPPGWWGTDVAAFGWILAPFLLGDLYVRARHWIRGPG